jgi:galactofuranosylgalactofuranosylrhamnosyl-N-acetylglucosaminyl-diphospho-decaprenol beta-1,5/1,6-galactofuranosyltransferase
MLGGSAPAGTGSVIRQKGPHFVTTSSVRPQLREHRATQRLLVQRGPLAAADNRVPDDMYAKVRSGTARRYRTHIELNEHARIDTNTYFGRFPASYWQRWTEVAAVRLHFDYVTTGLAKLVVRASDAHGHNRSVRVDEVKGDGHAEVDIPLNKFVDGGALWLAAEAVSGPLTISDVRWTVAAPEKLRPAAVVICTFNRPVDCVNTITAFASDSAVMDTVDMVCVVDQGTDRVDGHTEFGQLVTELGPKLLYLNQGNLGGAGGFSRGMLEVTGQAGAQHANVVLMDDDIMCEPESVLRMNAFANLTAAPTIIGSQMLSLTNPEYLHVSGEREVLDEIKAGDLTANALEGVNLTKKKQDARFDAGWNGWWTCLLPAEVIADTGLPLPLFFQWDDIEYGIRARQRGYPTVTLPHAGVWHADFSWKDYDDWSRYFSVRNGLMVSALHGGFDGKVISSYLFRKIGELIVSMQYGLAYTFIRAAEDFLQGPEMLADGGQAAMAAIRAERHDFPETKTLPAVSADSNPHTQISVFEFEPEELKEGRVLFKRAVNQYLGRVNRTPVSIPAHYARWWHVSLFSGAVVTDAAQAGVRIRKRDKALAVKLAKRSARVCRQLRRRAPEMKRRYTEALPQVTSVENWGRLLGLDASQTQ